MPSQRRIKVFGLLVIVFVVSILFYTNSARQSQGLDRSNDAGDFYAKTKSALDNKGDTTKKAQEKVGTGTKNENEDAEVAKAMSQRLKEAAQVAKDKTNAKAPKPDPPSSVVGVGSAAEGAREKGVAGRKKFTTGDDKQEVVKEEEEEIETPERRAARTELNKILKKAPSEFDCCDIFLEGNANTKIVIIFSKSYCPHSRRAKGILLEKYLIDPVPYVVELDQHEIGADLQSLLAEKTGRRTVPNVLVNGISIGGGDDVAELDDKKTLIDKINELGAKKILEAKERPVVAPQAQAAADAHEGHGLR